MIKSEYYLQQVLEVDVLLVRHVLQTILSVNLSASLVEVLLHGVIDWVSRDAGLLTRVRLLLRHPGDEDDLEDDDGEEEAPNDQDALECVDL